MASGQRPLSELSPMAQRRNSPSWNSPNNNNKQNIGGGDSSPFEASPMNNNNSNSNDSASPRLFWKGRDSPFSPSSENSIPYDPASPMSGSKRSSIENLKRASRVKTSSLMFGRDGQHEYDPAQVQPLDRPLAGGRPFGSQFPQSSESPVSSANADARRQLPSQVLASKTNGQDQSTPRRFGSPSMDSFFSGSPGKNQATPTKSSLSRAGRYSGRVTQFDPASEIWSDGESAAVDDSNVERSLGRHGKSVTFDAAPPQINEYEMTTPVPSSIASSSREGSEDSYEHEGDSLEQNSSMVDDSFDASLEDTAKTPVVLPEEWRFMSPHSANGEQLNGDDDPFCDDYDTSDRESTPGSVQEPQPLRPRVESMDSTGEHRPLPPLPGANSQASPDHSNSMASTMERASSGNGPMPSPLRPASCSKADLAGFGSGSSMSLEERLQLMMVRDPDGMASEAEKQRARRMRRANAKDKRHERDGDRGFSPMSGDSEREASPDILATPPHISRESILRDIKSEDADDQEDHDNSNLSESFHSTGSMPRDPDVPIPSLEADHDEVPIKEESEHELDLYSIPEYYMEHAERNNSPSRASQDDVGDDGSRYSRDDEAEAAQHLDDHSDDRSTPVQRETPKVQDHGPTNEEREEFSPVSNEDEEYQLDAEFLSYAERSISPVEGSSTIPQRMDVDHIRRSLQRPETPEQNQDGHPKSNEENDRETPPTPQSVIRHPISESPEPETVPEPVATIKSSVSGLRTKPSLTPADVETMAATRRQVSGQEDSVPPIREDYREDESTFLATHLNQGALDENDDTIMPPAEQEDAQETPQQRQSSLVKLDIPVGSNDDGLGLGLDQEFDRVIESEKVAFEHSLSQLSRPFHQLSQRPQTVDGTYLLGNIPNTHLKSTQSSNADNIHTKQRGYLMRQNTKVIVASSQPGEDGITPGAQPPAHAPEANQVSASPRKASQQTWTVEPWNGSTRRQSIKLPGATARKKIESEPVPPLPGHESNVKEAVEPDRRGSELPPAEEHEDGQERGRVFVKVVGVKNLDLPLPQNEHTHFALTLDNGIHCVTTAWLELGRSAPIGQEFELVVQNELEFQLTLQMKLDPPKPKQQAAHSKPQKTGKASAFSRVFASPKKRREMELRQQAEAQNDQMGQGVNLDPWEKVRGLVANDGSFARAYVSLNDYETQAFGRPFTVDVTCFNEWAVDEAASVSRSKRGGAPGPGSVQRRPPYHIGSLELQLLYVPKPKGATDEDMPKSMNACIREMRETDNTATRSWEGFLSQQGGDCPYWRRRHFKLQGTKLTAYHEMTRQPRATINLAKAAKLIDDKSILTQKETAGKNGRRRKSAFAEEEEGYMFVEEGFRIRFANGEVIDFYADSAAEKDGWMNVLSETVGKGYSAGSGKTKPWTELVLRHERNMAAKRDTEDRRMSKQVRPTAPPPGAAPPRPPAPPKQSMGPPPPPNKHPMAPPPKPRHQHRQSQPENGAQNSRHQKTRSLIF